MYQTLPLAGLLLVFIATVIAKHDVSPDVRYASLCKKNDGSGTCNCLYMSHVAKAHKEYRCLEDNLTMATLIKKADDLCPAPHRFAGADAHVIEYCLGSCTLRKAVWACDPSKQNPVVKPVDPKDHPIFENWPDVLCPRLDCEVKGSDVESCPSRCQESMTSITLHGVNYNFHSCQQFASDDYDSKGTFASQRSLINYGCN